MGKDHRVLCIIVKYMLGFKPTSVKSIYKSGQKLDEVDDVGQAMVGWTITS